VFYTNSIETVVNFYKDVLGFNLEYQQEDKFVSFIFPNGARLGIKKAKEEREKPGFQTVFIGVRNIENIYQELKDKGVTILKELVKLSYGKEFSILDPDKNKIEFIERE